MNPRIQKPASKKQANTPTGPTAAQLLAKMPRRPMSPEQQQAALGRVQEQAEQRVKLGQQLMQAADARLQEHQEVLEQINRQQQTLREQVQQDVAKSLQSYDQWMGRIDESFTSAIKQLNERIDQLELRVDASRGETEAMIERAAELMNQTQYLINEVFEVEDTVASEVDEAAQIAAEMQSSSTENDPHCKIDDLPAPPIDETADEFDDDTGVLEVEIMQNQEPGAMPDPLPGEDPDDEDVFGEVLRRLRSERGDDNAAA